MTINPTQRENIVASLVTGTAGVTQVWPKVSHGVSRITAAAQVPGVENQLAKARLRMEEMAVEHRRIGGATPHEPFVANGLQSHVNELSARRNQLTQRASQRAESLPLNGLAVGLSIGGVFLHGYAARAATQRGNNTAAWANGMAATGHGMVLLGKFCETASTTGGGERAAISFGKAGLALATIGAVAAIVASHD